MNAPQPLYDVFDAATKVNSPWALGAFAIAGVVAIIWIWLSRSGSEPERANAQLVYSSAPEGRIKGWPDSDVKAGETGAHPALPESEPAASEPWRDSAGNEIDVQKMQHPPVPHEKLTPALSASSGIPWLAWVVLGLAIVVPVSAWAFVATHSDLPYLFRVVVYDKVRGLIQNPHVVCGAPSCVEQGVIDSAAQFQLAPSSVPAGNAVVFYADSETSRGKQSVTLGKARSVPVEVDIEPTLEPQPGAVQPQPNKPSPSRASSATAPTSSNVQNQAVDTLWLGDYVGGQESNGERGIAPERQTWDVSISQKNTIVLKFIRSVSTANGQKIICNAVWRGSVMSGNPGVLDFRGSRSAQPDYFCDEPMVMSIEGTLERTGEQSFETNSLFTLWNNVRLELRRSSQ